MACRLTQVSPLPSSPTLPQGHPRPPAQTLHPPGSLIPYYQLQLPERVPGQPYLGSDFQSQCTSPHITLELRFVPSLNL